MNKEQSNTMIKSRRTRGVAAALIAFAMVAAACGDDKEDSGDTTVASSPETTGSSDTTDTTATTDSTPETFPEPTGEPVKIGTTIWNQPLIQFNLRLPGIAAAVDYINSHGGIQGRPLEWIFCGAVDANEGEACTHQMIDEGVIATVEDANYAAEGVHVQLMKDAGIPIIDPFANAAATYQSENVYGMCPPTPIQYAGMVGYMAAKGLKTAELFSGDTSQAVHNEEIIATAAEFYGIEILGRVGVPLTAADYLPQVQAAVDAGADVNIAIIAPFMSALTLQATEQLGVPFHMAVSEGQFNAEQYEQYGQAGGGLDESLLVDCMPPFSASDRFPALAAAVEAMIEQGKTGTFKDLDDGTGTTVSDLAEPGKLTSLATRAWFGVMAFAAAANEVEGELTSAAIMDVLDNSAGIDLGLQTPWIPSTVGPPEFPRVSNSFVYLSTAIDGESVLFQDDPIDASESLR